MQEKLKAAEETQARYIKSMQEKAQPYDWPEDYTHENGMYFNECCQCHVHFTGHKRRVVCKLCAPKITHAVGD